MPQERTHSSRGLYTYSGAVAGGTRGRKIVNVVGNCRKIVNIVGNCQRCRRGVGVGGVSEDLKCCRPEHFLVCRKSTALAPPPKKKTWVPRRHCLLNNTVILRSRACTFTVGCSHCHIQNSLQITKTSFKVPKKRVDSLGKKSMKNL